MPATKDFYDLLGVTRDADEKTIKSAYRRLARECHPDVNPNDPGAEERFKSLSEAYHVLSDPQRRAAYDHYGPEYASYQGNGGGGPQPDFSDMFRRGTGPFADLGDIFETLLGGASQRAPHGRGGRRDGANLERDLEIDFATSVFGGTETLRVELDEPCPACDGMGVHYRRCEACGGTGVQQGQRGMFGMAVCPACGGRRQVPGDRCTECRGSGAVHRSRRVEVKVPAGVRDGSRVRVRGEGLAGTGGGSRGDLVLVIRVRPHAFFRREGDDLACEAPVSFTEAALGAEITVPTKDGRATLKIPAGTQSGQVFRMRGLGPPRLKGPGCGDQLVTVRVAVPKKLSKQARKTVEELARELTDDVRAGLEEHTLRRD